MFSCTLFLPIFIMFCCTSFIHSFIIHSLNESFCFQLQHAAEVQRRGCTLALQRITCHFGSALPQKVPQLWQMLTGPLEDTTWAQNTTSLPVDNNSVPAETNSEPTNNDTEPVNSNQTSQDSSADPVKSSTTPIDTSPGSLDVSSVRLEGKSESLKSKSGSLECKSGSMESSAGIPEPSSKSLPANSENMQDAVNWLQLMEVVMPSLHTSLVDQVRQ